MKKILSALLLALMTAIGPPLAGEAEAQNGANTRQSGNVTPGHVPMWAAPGVIQDGGTAFQGFLTSLGITAQGPSFCINSAPVTQAYNRMCMGVSTAAHAIFSLQNLGGAAAQSLDFVINGTTYTFPFSGAGSGNVIGPNSSTIGDIAMFANTAGTLISSVPTIPIIDPSSVGAPSSSGSGCNPIAGAGAVLHTIPYTDQNWCTLFNLWSMSSIEPSALLTLTVGGTITAGDVITLTFFHIRSSIVTSSVSYTVQGGDTTETIAIALSTAIRANPTFYTLPSGGYQSGAIFAYVPAIGPSDPPGFSNTFYADYDARYTLTWQYTVSGASTETITSGPGWYAGPIYYGGTTAGAANAQTITISGFVETLGVSARFKAGFTNTAAMTLQVNAALHDVRKYNSAGAIVAVASGDVVAGSSYVAVINGVCNCWVLNYNSTPQPTSSTKGAQAILPNYWDATFVVQPSRVTGSNSTFPQLSGAAPPGSQIWFLSPACQTTAGTSVVYGNVTCAQFGLISGPGGLAEKTGGTWLITSGESGLWAFGNGIYFPGGCAYLFDPGCGLRDMGQATINAAIYYANNLAGLSVTKTVRAAGGAANCTLIFTGGLLTGGTC